MIQLPETFIRQRKTNIVSRSNKYNQCLTVLKYTNDLQTPNLNIGGP
ncbi:15863_t:CDS:2 [Dentiscutata heterogama]|uniref:15863_t:CDS:1 n=1 Tax=Dentiscutata heterogama TaxID=1316150 RepID=A0ACA9JV49_9GLOM|nr:15863_t:CDS:2 [Dentiscutata heterogama]